MTKRSHDQQEQQQLSGSSQEQHIITIATKEEQEDLCLMNQQTTDPIIIAASSSPQVISAADSEIIVSEKEASSSSSSGVSADSSVIEDNNNNHPPVSKKIKLEQEQNNTMTTTSSISNTSASIAEESSFMTNNNSSATNSTTTTAASRVVHVRNIPPDADDTDLINLALPFGKISNLLLLRGKNQAMIEFAELSSAQCMVSYWQTTAHSAPPTVRGRTVYCQFSNHQQIKSSSNDHSNNNNNTVNGGGGHHQHHVSLMNGNNNNNNTNAIDSNGGGSSSSPVLRVVVDQPLYGVTLDNYHQLFSRCGKVNKIVTFHKNGSMQALIQFDSMSAATIARNSLDGTSMFGNNHNILRVGFSKLTNLNVKYNNDKSRDYTIHASASAAVDPSAASSAAMMAAAAVDPVTLAAYAAAAAAANQHPYGATGSSNSSASAASAGHGHLNHAAAAAASNMAMAYAHHPNAVHGNSGSSSRSGVHRADVPGSAMGGMSHHHPHHAAAMLSAGSPMYGMASSMGMAGGGAGGTVLLVSSIPEQVASPEALFTLFGVFGDVMRVKVLFAKQDNALIQMAEPAQAALALAHLDKLRFLNKTLHVTLSKHSSVQLPKEGSQDSGLTRDFSSCSQLHRFKKPGSKNYCNIFPPSLTLHLSNIPASCSEQDLRDMFSRVIPASSITGFKFFPRDRKMALVSLSSLDDSILALIKLHNAQLAESSHLRVSFSKSSI